MLRFEIESQGTSVPRCLLRLLHDLALLERDVYSIRRPSSFQIERLLLTIGNFERPAPRAHEWFGVFEYARNLFERAAADGVTPTIGIRNAFMRVAQFVRENADLGLETTLR